MNEFLDLNKFTKQAEIGHGSFGQVFKVVEAGTDIIYAAKISLTKLNDSDKKFLINLKREVNILSQLNHPSVLKFIGYSPLDFEQKSYPVIITEYSPNGSLYDIIKRERKSISPKSWSDTKKLINLYGIASAMSYLHSHNIIHRDLKPANILEDENLFPKIADFGLSKVYHQNIESMTAQSTIGFKGTPVYTAPEIWLNYDYSKAGDVYSFSFIAYELFAFDEPFKNLDLTNLYSKIVLKNERPEFKYHIPSCYKRLIEKCWSSNPKERPSFQEIVIELRTNKEFITETIDEEEYLKYIDFVDGLDDLFDQDIRIENITPVEENIKKDSNEEIEKKSDEKKVKIIEDENVRKIDKKTEKIREDKNGKLPDDKSQDEDFQGKIVEKSITVKEFNNLPLKSQQFEIANIIANQSRIGSNESLLNVNKLLKYLIQFEPNSSDKYFSIPTKEDVLSVEGYLKRIPKFSLSYEAFELISKQNSLEISEFYDYIKDINTIFIEIKYPTKSSFDKIYEEIKNLKQIHEDQIRINISIDGPNKTDMKFRNDKSIDTLLICESVEEIIGNDIGFKNSGGGSFSGCSSLKQVIIPETIKSIGNYSFCGCSTLTQISLPSSIKIIGEGSFSGCSSLVEITIPYSVISIESYAFFGCHSLKQVLFKDESSLEEIGEYAFSLCISLTQISVPYWMIKIKDYAFSECPLLKYISIRNNNTKIGKNVFDKCENITLINDMDTIQPHLFNGCTSLTQITIPSSVSAIKESAFEGCSSLTQITIPSKVKKIDDNTFERCSSLTEISIPELVIKIGKSAFLGCTSLKQVLFESPSSIYKIGQDSFCGCSSLTQIELPSSVTKIKKGAFKLCTSLIKIIIPSTVTEIGESSFYQCSSLAEVTIPSSIQEIQKYTFYGCSSLTQVSFGIPSSITKIDDSAFIGCSSLKQIIIPSSVTEIGQRAFENCSSLEQISFPSSLSSIKEHSFTGCSSLEQILIPSSVVSIEKYSFTGCSSLSQISFENDSALKSIGESSFEECSSLKQIYIPQSVTEIGSYAFFTCSSLTQITIPSSVTEIGKYAFAGCSSLVEITFENQSSVTSIKNYSFIGCSSLKQISIPSSVSEICEGAFRDCTSLLNISFENPSSVELIGKYSFIGCSSLTEISIPSSVTKIDKFAFSECSSLSNVSIPSSLTFIGDCAFYKCSSLIPFSIPSSVTEIGDHIFDECKPLDQAQKPSLIENQEDFHDVQTKSIPFSVTEIGDHIFDECRSLDQAQKPSPLENQEDFHNVQTRSIPSFENSIEDNDSDEFKQTQNISLLVNQEIALEDNEQMKPIPSSENSEDKVQIIDKFISQQDAQGLIQYLHDSCDNDTISMTYEKCRQTSPDFYVDIANKGIAINDAVSHKEYATICIDESWNCESLNESRSKLNEAVCHLKESVKNGNLYSCLLLSLVYHDLYKKDVNAFNWALRGSKQGEKHCECLIGYYIAHGIGTKKDFMKGVSIILSNKIDNFYEKFATDIGLYYTNLSELKEGNQECDDADQKMAFKWFETAFNKNKTKATINNLGICYLNGYGVEKNIEKAKEIFEEGLLQNDPNSMYHIGFIYEEEDPIKSLQFYKKAADLNHVHAQSKYAFSSSQNNKEEAMKYYKLASNQGDINSHVSLAKQLNETDHDLSINLYKKAAEKGNIESQEFLAKKFSQENDSENFDKYCKILIKNGHTNVPFEFAVNLYKSKKYDQAFYYFSLLRSVNHPIASYFIGVMNFYGQGCVRNESESFKILKDLSNKGIEEATNFIEEYFD